MNPPAFDLERLGRTSARARWLTIFVALVALVLLGAPPRVQADTAASSNWAGYAAHRAGVRFRQAYANWRQPNLICSPGHRTYSAVWVGLGGYRQSSKAVEQVGTEADCNLSGQTVTSAWYELVPALSKPIAMSVWPGDLVAAEVIVAGHVTTILITDQTRHETFSKRFPTTPIDASSAEWIVEAPDQCTSPASCQRVPLADFGRVSFTDAGALDTSRARGSISSRVWHTTRIVLTAGGRHFASSAGAAAGVPSALPSALLEAGRAFTVRYAHALTSDAVLFGERQPSASGSYLLHSGR